MAELQWTDFVAADALVAIGNYAANIQEPATKDAVEIATGIAKEHNHMTFLWTVADINEKAAPAAAAAAAAVSAVVAAAATNQKRAALYAAVRASAHRPILVGDSMITVSGVNYHTRRGATAMAIWDATHPAAPLLGLFKAEQLERSDASALYTFMAKTLDENSVQSRATTVARAVATLVQISNSKP